MEMMRFKYCGTHIKDEEYMNKMSQQGWQAKKLVEGFWTFEKDNTHSYTYRIYYFRGMGQEEVNHKIEELKKEGIEFVSRYSFWGIFRSQQDFQLYPKEEQLQLCHKIRKPMIIAVILCPIIFVLLFLLGNQVNHIFFVFSFLLVIYGFVCLYLMIAYTKLIRKLKG